MEFSIGKPAKRRAGTAGIEPALAALETAVLPLNYVPKKGNQGKEKPPVKVSLRAVPGSRLIGVTQEPARHRGHTWCLAARTWWSNSAAPTGDRVRFSRSVVGRTNSETLASDSHALCSPPSALAPSSCLQRYERQRAPATYYSAVFRTVASRAASYARYAGHTASSARRYRGIFALRGAFACPARNAVEQARGAPPPCMPGSPGMPGVSLPLARSVCSA